MRTALLFALMLLFPFSAVHAQNTEGNAYEPPLAVDLASNHVDITTGFHGSRLVLYGVHKQPGAVAVVIKGPERTMLVRRKGQVLGAWVNTQSLKFRRVPSYYDYAISTNSRERTSPDLLKRYGIGLDALYFDPDTSREDQATIRDFQEALIRNKQIQGVYPVGPKSIKFLSGNFFKAEFYMPPNLPSGLYEVQTYLISGGDVVETRSTHLSVAQVGFNASVNNLASHHSFLYAFLALFIAVGAGWSINLLRR
ncbi:MAG: TIGR02186 family protein [Alphaproteobacteria bacterium]|nr:TIGR02186 family protein [Alphaproteobacteria bacterium]